MAVADMKEPAFVMKHMDRQIVQETIARHCTIRGWRLHAANARSNHVHAVLTASGYSPETVRDQLKAWCTRMLKQVHRERERFWTEGASCRWINQTDDLESAIIYTRDGQDHHLDT